MVNKLNIDKSNFTNKLNAIRVEQDPIYILILAWFLIQAIFFAFTSNYTSNWYVPPDEGFHKSFIQLYADDSWSPFLDNQDQFGNGWRSVVRIPQYFYHYCLSFFVRFLSIFGVEDFTVWLRMTNVSLSLMNLVVLTKTMKLLKFSRGVRNTSLFIFVNLMMYTTLSGSINYDNALNLFASLLIYYFVKQSVSPDKTNLIKILIIAVFGSVIKFTFLPLIAVTGILILVNFKKYLVKETLGSLFAGIKSFDKRNLVLALFCFLGLFLFVERYGLNYTKYGTYKPQCEQVHTLETCNKSALFRRNSAFKVLPVEDRMGVAEFVARWSDRSHKKTVGTLSHREVRTFTKIERITYWLWIAGLLVMLRKICIRGFRNDIVSQVGFIALFYMAVVIYHNYGIYIKSSTFGIALHGRYLFPIYFYLIALPIFWISETVRTKFIKQFLALGLVAVFAFASLPAHIVKGDDKNYLPKYQDEIRSIQENLIKISS